MLHSRSRGADNKHCWSLLVRVAFPAEARGTAAGDRLGVGNYVGIASITGWWRQVARVDLTRLMAMHDSISIAAGCIYCAEGCKTRQAGAQVLPALLKTAPHGDSSPSGSFWTLMYDKGKSFCNSFILQQKYHALV